MNESSFEIFIYKRKCDEPPIQLMSKKPFSIKFSSDYDVNIRLKILCKSDIYLILLKNEFSFMLYVW